MAMTITDERIDSDETSHHADWSPDAAADGQGAWIVSWLPGRRLLTRTQAITAMTLAEIVNGDGDRVRRLAPVLKDWAAELGLDVLDAVHHATDRT